MPTATCRHTFVRVFVDAVVTRPLLRTLLVCKQEREFLGRVRPTESTRDVPAEYATAEQAITVAA